MTRPGLRDLGRPDVAVATWLGSGLLPRAPGTWGSAAALPFAWLITTWWGQAGLAVAVAVVFAAGLWSAERASTRARTEDPGWIVVDEVCGQWLVLLAAPIGDGVWYGVGFAVFRIFDIVKPWPVSWAERRFRGGLGIMLDDVLAGVYGMGVLWGLVLWAR